MSSFPAWRAAATLFWAQENPRITCKPLHSYLSHKHLKVSVELKLCSCWVFYTGHFLCVRHRAMQFTFIISSLRIPMLYHTLQFHSPKPLGWILPTNQLAPELDIFTVGFWSFSLRDSAQKPQNRKASFYSLSFLKDLCRTLCAKIQIWGTQSYECLYIKQFHFTISHATSKLRDLQCTLFFCVFTVPK